MDVITNGGGGGRAGNGVAAITFGVPEVTPTLAPTEETKERFGSELVGKGAVKVLLVSVVDKLVLDTGVTSGENRVGEIDTTTIGATLSAPTKLTCRGASGSSKVPLPMLPVPISMRL